MAGRSGFFRNWACCCYGLFIIAALLLLPAVGEARGLFMQRPVRSWLDTPKWDLDLGYRYRGVERSGPGGSEESSRHVFTEGFTVTSRGWTYHPALLRYNLSLSPSWEQDRRQEFNGRRNSRDQMRLEYAIDGTLMAIKPYATDFYAERDSTTRTSDRAQATTVDRTSYGAALYLPWGRENFPTRIIYTHLDSTSDRGDSATTNSTDRFSLSSSHVQQRHRTSLRASYSDSRQQSSAGRSSDSQLSSGGLQNTLYLTEDRQLRLNSQLDASITSASSRDDRERLRLREELRWDRRHSPTLRSYYLGRYTHNRNDDLTDNSYQLESGLNHQLYENLSTNLLGNAQHTTSDFSENTSYGANLGMNYNRRIPTGSVQLNMTQGYVLNQREQLARQETKIVDLDLGECLDVDGSLPFTCEFSLEDIGVTIIADSLELTNLTPPRTQTAPIAEPSGDFRDLPFELIRVAGQQIIRFTATDLEALDPRIDPFDPDFDPDANIFSEGWLLELSYEVESDPSYDSATWNHSYGARLNVFSNWILYYRTSFAEERFLAGTRPDTLTDNRFYATGIAWNKRMEHNSLSSSYDYSESTSADSTSRSQTISAGFDRSLAWLPATWSNNASYSITTTDTRATTTLLDVNDNEFLADEIFADENVTYRLTSAVDFRFSRGRQLRLQGGYTRTTTDGTTTVDGQPDTFSVRESDDYNIAANLRLRRGLSANLSASFRQSEATTDTRFREEERILIRSRLRKQVSRTSRLELDGSYRNRISNQPYEDKLYTLGGRYEYRNRLIRLIFDYRYSDDRNLLADSRVIGHAVMVTFKRALN